MKIEKVNEHQIRCTLTREDLAIREIKISELAYGTDKTKGLFREMMQQAAYEYGFEAEDIPLMIEMIPLNSECIVLIITKVDDPEELDTRFSKFAPSIHEDEDSEEEDLTDDLADSAEDVLNMLRRLGGTSSDSASLADAAAPGSNPPETRTQPADQLVALRTLDDAIRLSRVIRSYPSGSALYKDSANGRYLLLLKAEGMTVEAFRRLNYTLSEYGSILRSAFAKRAYLEEHCEPILGQNAIPSLAKL